MLTLWKTVSYPTKLISTGHKMTLPDCTAVPDEKDADTTKMHGYKISKKMAVRMRPEIR